MASLPGQPYDGTDPDGFMPRDEIVGRVAGYAEHVRAPVLTGTAVDRLTPVQGGGFSLHTSAGPMRSDEVVVPPGATTCLASRTSRPALHEHPRAPLARVSQRRLAAARRRPRRRVGPDRYPAGRRAAGRRPTRTSPSGAMAGHRGATAARTSSAGSPPCRSKVRPTACRCPRRTPCQTRNSAWRGHRSCRAIMGARTSACAAWRRTMG